MDIKQIERKLLVGKGRMCVVSISSVREFPGYVRVVQIEQGPDVSVMFEQYGYRDGGVCFTGSYTSLEEAVSAVEKYLNLPLSEWTQTVEYPSRELPEYAGDGHANLVAAISNNSILLPEGGNWELVGDEYWLQFAQKV